MKLRLSCLLLLLCIPLTCPAKDKNTVPDYVLQARTVQIIVTPDSSVTLDRPTASTQAREQVRRALQAWGRFDIVFEGQADLVIAIHAGTGRFIAPVIQQGADTRIGTQSSGGTIGVGGRQGTIPADSDPGPVTRNSPHVGTEIGGANDTFEVYRGDTANPLRSSPVFQYIAKDALKAPDVPAVARFRKAIENSEKQSKKKP